MEKMNTQSFSMYNVSYLCTPQITASCPLWHNFQSPSGCRETRIILICSPFGSNNGKVAENLSDWTLISTLPHRTNSVDRRTSMGRNSRRGWIKTCLFLNPQGNTLIFMACYLGVWQNVTGNWPTGDTEGRDGDHRDTHFPLLHGGMGYIHPML